MLNPQMTMVLSPFLEIYNLIIPKDNMLRRINEMVDFSFIYDELVSVYCPWVWGRFSTNLQN
jgi:hypothetical protein